MFKSAIEQKLITAKDYVELLKKISRLERTEIELLVNLNWTNGLPIRICQRLYEEEFYIDYVCNMAITSEEAIDYTKSELISSICEDAGWIEKNAESAWNNIRQGILKRGHLLTDYMVLFKAPFILLSEEELNLIEDYKDAIELLKNRTDVEDHLKMIADYFNKKYRNQTETYNILTYVVSLPNQIAYKLFYMLNMKNLPYRMMSVKRRSELNAQLIKLFDVEASPEKTVELVDFIGMSIPSIEKDLYEELNNDEVLCKKYVRYANRLQSINMTVAKNIWMLKRVDIYSNAINEKMYETKHYEIYISSKTASMEKFEIEDQRKEVLWSVYVKMFHSPSQERTQNYMKENKEFLNELIEKSAYENAGDMFKNYAAAMQTKELIAYAFEILKDDLLSEYLTSVDGFKNYEAAHCFVGMVIQRTNVLASSAVYKNCHEKLIDAGLKGWYTKARKKLKC
jgi:hypothetical protein